MTMPPLYGRDYFAVNKAALELPRSTKVFNSSYKQLGLVPRGLPPDLEVLTLNGCGLYEIDWLPPRLRVLNISLNCLQRITCPLPETLEELNIGSTFLKELPSLPASLRSLNATDTPLKKLLALPAELKALYAANTDLEVLPEPLPKGLTHLNIGYTRISVAPCVIPDSLLYLSCQHTQIRHLPALPGMLEVLHCNDTPLEEVPIGLERMVPPYTWERGAFCDTRMGNCPNLPEKGVDESYLSWWRRLMEARDAAWRRRAAERMEPIKEELMAAAWSPARVESWLAAGVELEAL